MLGRSTKNTTPITNMNTTELETFRQEISGTLYAQNLLLNVLFKDYINYRLPGKGQGTEHLDALVGELEQSFSAQLPKMSPVASAQAKKVIFDLLGASCQEYWKGDPD